VGNDDACTGPNSGQNVVGQSLRGPGDVHAVYPSLTGSHDSTKSPRAKLQIPGKGILDRPASPLGIAFQGIGQEIHGLAELIGVSPAGKFTNAGSQGDVNQGHGNKPECENWSRSSRNTIGFLFTQVRCKHSLTDDGEGRVPPGVAPALLGERLWP
jgi:hypothetical protein